MFDSPHSQIIKRNHMTVSTDIEKALDNILYIFMKTPNKLRIE